MIKEVQQKRMEICNSCEFLFKPTHTCKRCGCFMKLKTRLSSSFCPIHKWGSEDGPDVAEV